MSFSLTFTRYDNDVLDIAIGSGDGSMKAAIDDEYAKRTARHDGTSPEWEQEFVLGRELAHRVIDHGSPETIPATEELRHRLAAEWLIQACRIPGYCDAQVWRWAAFYDTIHSIPGFEDPIVDLVHFLDEGRPFFGCSCPDEMTYGFLNLEESKRFLAQCLHLRAAFEARPEAQHSIGSLIQLFDFAVEGKSHLWFGMW